MKEDDVHTCAAFAHCVFIAAPEANEGLDPVQRVSDVASYRNIGSRGHRGYLDLLSKPSLSLVMNWLPQNLFGFIEFERPQNITKS